MLTKILQCIAFNCNFHRKLTQTPNESFLPRTLHYPSFDFHIVIIVIIVQSTSNSVEYRQFERNIISLLVLFVQFQGLIEC